jgi:hypothetical protein
MKKILLFACGQLIWDRHFLENTTLAHFKLSGSGAIPY